MSPDRIKTILEKQPFEPFTIVTGDGSEVNVLSREFAMLRPGGRTLLVAAPKFPGASEEKDFEDHTIDVFLITKIVTPVRGQANSRRRKAS
jgi:hypothetical protein